jgi:hypothetical protein
MDPATKTFSFGDTPTAEKERGLDLRGLKANAAQEIILTSDWPGRRGPNIN